MKTKNAHQVYLPNSYLLVSFQHKFPVLNRASTKQHKLTINLFTFIIALSLKFDDAKLDKKIKKGSISDLTSI